MARHQQRALRRALGERLRELRLRHGPVSQESLAHRAGVHRTYVGRIERGESGVTVEALATILAAMAASLAEFFRSFDEPLRLPTPRKRKEG